MPRRKQHRPMRVGEGEEDAATGPDLADASTPENVTVVTNDEKKKEKESRRSLPSKPSPPPTQATSSPFFPLDLSIKKSTSSTPPRFTPSPVRNTTISPVALAMNGSSDTHRSHNTHHTSPMGQKNSSSGKGLMKGGMSASGTRSSSSRQNPWQTQWMNRSSEQTRDVFTCVWCKESFKSLQDMTLHMKKSPRCGMAGMQQAAASAASLSSALTSSSGHLTGHHVPSSPHIPNHHLSHHGSQHVPHHSSGVNGSMAKSRNHHSGATSSSTGGNSTSVNNSSSNSKEPMSSAVLAKNNVALPRKLVRGQDVWLGRGAEQTRQILKCMWCAQSFKSLDEMTRHMRITQHYTNIISQEQIISWRTPEDKVAQAQVNAVLTCKVCDEAFGSLKELSYHMVKNAHYKEHILRSITEGGHGRRRQTRERRKKSLPVRKLLELERMEIVPPSESSKSLDVTGPGAKSNSSDKMSSRSETPNSKQDVNNRGSTPLSSSSSITCDECSEQIDSRHFISHLKECIKQQLTSGANASDSLTRSPKSIPRSPDSAASTSGRPDSTGPPSRSQTESPSSLAGDAAHSDGSRLKIEQEDEEDEQDAELEKGPVDVKKIKKEKEKREEKSPKETAGASEGPAPQASSSSACLSALENLIEKSFEMKPTALRTSSHKTDKSSRDHRHHRGHHSKSLKSPSALSVEKWMTLAKERDAPSTFASGANMWSPSMSSSSSSSWNHHGSDEETEPKALIMNLKKASDMDDLRSPESSASTDSRSSKAKRSAASPSPQKAGVVASKRKKMKTEAGDERRKTPISKLDSEEERREEIEELKRSGLKSLESESATVSGAKNTSSESLSALERLIEKSFDSKKKNTPTGFLQRLGIDEEVCPPWQPGLLAAALPFGHPFQPWLMPKLHNPIGHNQDSRSSSSSSPAKSGPKNGSICSSPPAT